MSWNNILVALHNILYEDCKTVLPTSKISFPSNTSTDAPVKPRIKHWYKRKFLD